MNDAVNGKKKWSKKKKIAVIVLSILLAFIILVVCAGVTALNWYCKTASYQIITSTSQDVTLVAHRGLRSVAPENTAPAFEEAGKAGFWGAECDIYRTSDGVWVITHDSNTYRMMDKSAWVEKKTYNELMEQNVDNGTNIEDYPDLKFCTLEEYLKICKEYNMVPVIELKCNNNTEHYDEFIKMIKDYELEAVYISFQFENLKALRDLTDAPLYYLTQEISEDDIDLAKSLDNCGIDFNGNKDKNFETGIIKKCIDEGLEVGAWTIDTQESYDRLVENGVTLITTDCIIPEK